jgi:hypothetical protein
MKKLLYSIGGVLVAIVVVLLVLRVTGFNAGPTTPGLWLRGEVVTEPITDWTFLTKDRGLTGIQTRQWFLPILAHSVLTTRFVHEGKLYVGSGYPAGVSLPDGRHWNRNVVADPHVRLMMGGKLYDRKLVYVSDEAERDRVMRAYGPMFFAPGFYLHLWRVEPTDENL